MATNVAEVENPEILTDAQIRRVSQYAKAVIRCKGGKCADWIFDDLKQDFAEQVVRSTLAGYSFKQALHKAAYYLIDMLRSKRYYFSRYNYETKERYYEYTRFSQMDWEAWDEFYEVHSHNPEQGYMDSILTHQLLDMMGDKEREAWELAIEGWTQDEIADMTGKVGRSMISKRQSKGIRQTGKTEIDWSGQNDTGNG